MANKQSAVAILLQASRKAFFYVALFSFLMNILMLTVPIYMLQLFDRVLPNQSYDTLLYLTLIAIMALMVVGLLDLIRGRILVRISIWLDNKLSPVVLSRSPDTLLKGDSYGTQVLKDIASLRVFLGSPSIVYLFDSPWVPFYLLVIFMLYPVLGLLATFGAIILFGLALANEISTRAPLSEANFKHIQTQYYIDNALKNSESIQAMGMLPDIVHKWFAGNKEVLDLQTLASDRAGIITSLAKFLRLVLQLGMLGLGAYYVIQGIITPGTMIAASIITARALAPVEQAIGTWKQSVSTYQAYLRLKDFVSRPDLRSSTMTLPKAQGNIQFENVFYTLGPQSKPILQGIHFLGHAGETIGIIGPSGAGKSTLARLLLGVWAATAGSVRLDGANIYTWDRVDFGRQVGYLPQKVELFVGTVKENIARMGAAEDQKIIEAAQLADAHDMILHLPQGYDSPTGGYTLSGGESQRVALARAFYGDPCLMVLDEPESNLDHLGEAALMKALQTARARGITVLLISQRPGTVTLADKILVLNQGKMQAFGPAQEILPKIKTLQNTTPAKEIGKNAS